KSFSAAGEVTGRRPGASLLLILFVLVLQKREGRGKGKGQRRRRRFYAFKASAGTGDGVSSVCGCGVAGPCTIPSRPAVSPASADGNLSMNSVPSPILVFTL